MARKSGQPRKKGQETAPVKPPVDNSPVLPAGYDALLTDLKARIRAAQVRAAAAVNRELVTLYWQIGRDILARQVEQGWGAKVIDRLSRDLRIEFPGSLGYSPRNLKYMRAFAEAWPDAAIVQEALAQITWYHNITLLEKVADAEARLWYARNATANGWSRAVLVHQIELDLYARRGRSVTNFTATLPASDSDLARELLKDPYNFDFLTLADDAREHELQRGLLAHIRAFLLELGAGFAFVGEKVHLEVGGRDFYLDLLFFHLKLRCYIVVELKVGEFEPEHAGKMNFYLSAVDALLRHADDKPSLGIILCKTKNKSVVEFALRDIAKPVGVSDYVTRLVASLPPAFRDSLPSAEELEAELNPGVG